MLYNIHANEDGLILTLNFGGATIMLHLTPSDADRISAHLKEYGEQSRLRRQERRS